MSLFTLKCPHCGVRLEADEKDIGENISCGECDFHFILSGISGSSLNIGLNKSTINNSFSFTFSTPPVRLIYAKPFILTTPNGKFDVSNWSNVLLKCCEYVLERCPERIKSLLNHDTPFRKTILFATQKSLLRRPREIADGIYLEMNYSAHAIGQIVCDLVKYCELPPEDFSVAYSVSENIAEEAIGESTLPSCIQKLSSLNINNGNQYRSGAASHKPVMCLTLIYAIDKKLSADNLFHRKTLLPIFRKIWDFLANNDSKGNIWIPFKYLVNDGFWIVNADGTGSLDQEMYEFLSVSQNRIDAVNAILNTYFGYKMADLSILWEHLSSPNSGELPLNQDAHEDELENVRVVFNHHFQMGIRPGSIIDKNRFKRYYLKEIGTELRENFPFESILPEIGMAHDGKVFPLQSSENAVWKTLVNGLLNNGHTLLAYSRVMELHAQELMASGITSADMLHELLVHDASGEFKIGNKYFSASGETLNVADFLAADLSKNTPLVSEPELFKRHPYLCREDIHHVLASDLHYIRNEKNFYVICDRMIFDEDEANSVLAEVHRLVEKDGYCSLSHFDFEESISLNEPGITAYAARRVFFARYLASEFDKHGQIVSSHGEEIDSRIPLHEFCGVHSEITLEQVNAIAEDFNISGYLVMTTMHEEMVRVEQERFVAPSMISFDVALIDSFLDTCIHGKVMPLGAFHDFSQFPAVPGWSWNWYLLEAFLKRSSQKFRLLVPSVASKEIAGVVVRQDAAIDDVLDACAMVATEAGLSDDDAESIGNYLQKNRCILRRRTTLITPIMERMKMIGKGMK